jgi:glycosyltransferase involved in cell wall biosynthesis
MASNAQSVAAVVASYNEGPRIKPVLDALAVCPDISEIIVVDDGSRETLEWIHKAHPLVHLIRHEHNRGKAAAMESGVAAAHADYILFCDADLVGFTPQHASAIIRPVLSGTTMMQIGLRNNPEQRAVFLFALNSGERCIRRADWELLPSFYKKGFKIETGLNILVKKRGGRIGSETLSYQQTLRERKYGLREGLMSRIQLCFDVLSAWIYIAFVDWWS